MFISSDEDKEKPRICVPHPDAEKNVAFYKRQILKTKKR